MKIIPIVIIKIVGYCFKRRDNAPIVKLVCGEIVNILMNDKDPNGQ